MSTIITVDGLLKLGVSSTLPKLDPSTTWDPTVDDLLSSTPMLDGPEDGKRVIDPAEPCFITNKSSPANKQFYWLRDVPNNNNEKREIVRRSLMRKGLENKQFTFDNPYNTVNLDPDLRRAMRFDTFAVTCSLATMDRMIKIVKAQNKIGKEWGSNGAFYPRFFQILETTDGAEYEIVVLHPKYFLAPDAHLTRYPSPDYPTEAPKHYQVDAHGVLRESPATEDSPRFPSFRFESNNIQRRKESMWPLNPYGVILAAELKFRHYKALPNEPPLDAHYQALIAKTNELVDLLYWEARPGGLGFHMFIMCPDGTDTTDEGIIASKTKRDDLQTDNTNTDEDEEYYDYASDEDDSRPEIYWKGLYPARELPLTADGRALLREIERSYSQSGT